MNLYTEGRGRLLHKDGGPLEVHWEESIQQELWDMLTERGLEAGNHIGQWPIVTSIAPH
jgi:hypothetical protein